MGETASPRVEIVPATQMPDGHILLPVQRNGTTHLAIREGQITPELAAALNRFLPHIDGDGPLAPPGAG